VAPVPAGLDAPASLVGEDHPVGLIGIAFDAQRPSVMQSVVMAAQGEQIGGVGGSSVLPVTDVVDL
jgi:hypothetical protein